MQREGGKGRGRGRSDGEAGCMTRPTLVAFP